MDRSFLRLDLVLCKSKIAFVGITLVCRWDVKMNSKKETAHNSSRHVIFFRLGLGHSFPRALVGIHENDTQKDLEYCAKRLLGCKLWENDAGSPWRHGAKQRSLDILCVSQFTLYGKLTKKNQPDYKASMKAIPAKAMYEDFLELLKSSYEPDKIHDGVFGAMMDVGK